MIGAFWCQLYFAISRNIQQIIVMNDGKKEAGVVLNWSKSDIMLTLSGIFLHITVTFQWKTIGKNVVLIWPEDAHCYLFAAISHMLNLYSISSRK